VLDNNYVTLSDYGITNGAQIEVRNNKLPSSFDIFVYQPSARKTKKLTVKDSDTIAILKTKIQPLFGYKPAFQTLLFNGKNLGDSELIKDCGVYENANIELRNGERGLPVSATDVENKSNFVSQPISKSAPDWRQFDRGLNLEGVCMNECKAKNKKVIVPMDFNKGVSMSRSSKECICPCCKNQLSEANEMGFHNCSYTFKSRCIGETETIRKKCQTPDQIGYFKSNIQTMKEYQFLEVFVSPFDPKWKEN